MSGDGRPTGAPAPRVRSRSGGYAKGEASRQRLLEVALAEFGRQGFQATTTRQIAQAAGVTLPAIAYHFGHKEGLYLACADEVARRYRLRLGEVADATARALRARPAPDAELARSQLKRLVDALAQMLVGSNEAALWSGFVQAELGQPGPAFDALFQRLWSPGIELAAALIARVQGRASAAADDRLRALMLIAGLGAFHHGRPVALRTLGWAEIGAAQLDQVLALLHRQIDEIPAPAPRRRASGPA